MPYRVPHEVTDVIDKPIREAADFFPYVKSCLRVRESLDVWECNVLLAGLDVVGREIIHELETGRSEKPGVVLPGQEYLACCDYLADELRATRRRIIVPQIRRFIRGKLSLATFVSSVVLPMLSRRWLPAGWYEPAKGELAKDIKRWQGQRYPAFGKPSELLVYREEFRGMLERAGQGVNSKEESFLRILGALRSWELEGTAAGATASYLAAARRVSEQEWETSLEVPMLEVPILLVWHNQSGWPSGHVLRALFVPFAVKCTSDLFRDSLLPAVKAVKQHFSGSYCPPDVRGLLIGDYPGGVYCPGNVVSVSTIQGCKEECEEKCKVGSWFEGPSAGLSFGALLVAHAIGVKMLPHSYATAKLDPGAQVKALSNEQSNEEEPYLQAKGRTIALLAHASGGNQVHIVINEHDRCVLQKGAEQCVQEMSRHIGRRKVGMGEPSLPISYHAVSRLREALNYLLTDMYADLVEKLMGKGYTRNRLAETAARKILADGEIGRWVVSIPAQVRGISRAAEDFEMDLAREIYQSSLNAGLLRIPVCLDANKLFMRYDSRSRTTGALGRAVAELGDIRRTSQPRWRNSCMAQIEKDLYEGILILLLKGLAGYDSMGNPTMGSDAIEDLLHGLCSRGNKTATWQVKSIVTVRYTGCREASEEVLELLIRWGFREMQFT